MSNAPQAQDRTVAETMSAIEDQEYRDGWISDNSQVLSRIPPDAPDAVKLRADERARDGLSASESPAPGLRPWRLRGHPAWLAIADGYHFMTSRLSE